MARSKAWMTRYPAKAMNQVSALQMMMPVEVGMPKMLAMAWPPMTPAPEK